MVFGFDSEVLEDGIGPEPFHVILRAYGMSAIVPGTKKKPSVRRIPSFQSVHAEWDNGDRSLCARVSSVSPTYTPRREEGVLEPYLDHSKRLSPRRR